MRGLLTGGSGVLGRALQSLPRGEGQEMEAPTHAELDLFDRHAVQAALTEADAVFHLATRIPPREAQGEPAAWLENDRLRRDATRVLVDAALETGVQCVVFPSISVVYPPSGPADESTPVRSDVPFFARSALNAEGQVGRFAASEGRGVVLRLGLLYGPGTGSDEPAERYRSFGATLHIDDAGPALLAALEAPSGVYNVVSDGERVSNDRFKHMTGWRPEHSTCATRDSR
jgi:nucleoside-diphosphate-sugar epimerase